MEGGRLTSEARRRRLPVECLDATEEPATSLLRRRSRTASGLPLPLCEVGEVGWLAFGRDEPGSLACSVSARLPWTIEARLPWTIEARLPWTIEARLPRTEEAPMSLDALVA